MADTRIVQFIEDLYARVDAQIRKVVPTLVPDVIVPVQQNGGVVTNEHRILNFTGSGVVVTDDPDSRRTNVYIGGSALTTAPVQFAISSTSSRTLDLWNGSSNNSPPANWYTVGFNDSGWATPLNVTGGAATTIPGAARLWPVNTPSAFTQEALFRQSFTLAAGTYQGISLTVEGDNYIDAVYFNGTLLGSSTNGVPGTSQSKSTFSIDSSLLIVGTNVIAIHGRDADTVSGAGFAWIAHVMNGTGVTVVTATTTTVVTTLSGNVTMTTANTFYDGPSVSLSAGSWLLIGYADMGATTQMLGTMRITDGSTNYASGETFVPTSGAGSVCASAIVTPSSTTSYKIQCAGQQNNGTIRAATAANGSGNNATRLIAMSL